MSKLIVDGREYPFPDPDSLTLGEARIVKRYTAKNLRELGDVAPDDPDLIAAFVHVALARENPAVTMRDVDAIRLVTIETQDEEEVEPRPPDDPADRPASPEPPPPSGGGPSDAAGEPSREIPPSGSGDLT